MPGRQTGIFDIILRVYPRATSDDYAQTITGVNFAGPALLPTEPVRVGRAFGTPPPATAHPAPMLSIEDSSLDLDLASRPEPRLAHRQATTKLWQGRSAGEILTFDGLPEYPPASLADFQKAASGKAIDTARVYRVGEEVGGQDARAAFFKTVRVWCASLWKRSLMQAT